LAIWVVILIQIGKLLISSYAFGFHVLLVYEQNPLSLGICNLQFVLILSSYSPNFPIQLLALNCNPRACFKEQEFQICDSGNITKT